ncbi:putative serine protein kinase [Geopyxis carbonaria]|nr:putative serine protein kinase [Geopyxis carbonaria]
MTTLAHSNRIFLHKHRLFRILSLHRPRVHCRPMSAPPETPSSEMPKGRAQWRFETHGAPCEWGEAYRPGHFHPVHFGDVFHGRYRVIRKLGDGSFSTVWLAVDDQARRYVALKIVVANKAATANEAAILDRIRTLGASHPGAAHVLALLDRFAHAGPNGVHLCLVFDAMGASAARMRSALPATGRHDTRYPLWMAKQMLRQTLHGLAFLHAHGIAHGDVQPGNMLLSASTLPGVDAEAALRQDCGDPERCPPLTRLDGKADRWAPRYLAIGQPLAAYTDVEPGALTVKVSDLGAAFRFAAPPAKAVTPLGLRAPELVRHAAFDHRIDVWSFGCLVFELLTGRSLFCVMSDDDDHLQQLTDTLGPLPAATGMIGTPPEEARFRHDSLETRFASEKPAALGDAEAAVVVRLIRGILQYDPARRPSFAELCAHPWFQ